MTKAEIDALKALMERYEATDRDDWRETQRGKIAAQAMKLIPTLIALAETAADARKNGIMECIAKVDREIAKATDMIGGSNSRVVRAQYGYVERALSRSKEAILSLIERPGHD